MQSQVKPLTVVRLATENIRCSFDSCEALAALDLGEQPLCPIHFFPACTQELESWNDALRNQPFDAAGSEQFKSFAAACAEYAQELEKDERFADSRLKPLLLEFLLRISQLTRRLRRSPRMKLAVPVWLRREDSSRTWEEATWTTTVSRHGASLKCHHPVQTGGTVVLCRKDGGYARKRAWFTSATIQKAKKKSALNFWIRPTSGGLVSVLPAGIPLPAQD